MQREKIRLQKEQQAYEEANKRGGSRRSGFIRSNTIAGAMAAKFLRKSPPTSPATTPNPSSPIKTIKTTKLSAQTQKEEISKLDSLRII